MSQERLPRLPLRKRIVNCLLCRPDDPNSPRKSCVRFMTDCLKPDMGEPTVEGEQPAREQWQSRTTFFLSALGTSVGLGQLWRFPTLAYKMGGGAFVIVHSAMIMLIGNAMYFFEIASGQYTSKNPLKVYDKVPLMQGVGIAMISYSFFFVTYYNQMVSFAFYYLYACFSKMLPWTYCPDEEDFYDPVKCWPRSEGQNQDEDAINCNGVAFTYNQTELCRNSEYATTQKTTCCTAFDVAVDSGLCNGYFNVTDICRQRELPSVYFWSHTVARIYRQDDPNYGYLGGINEWLLLTSFVAWLSVYLSLYKGLKSMGFVMYIFVPMPYIILTIMLCVTVPQDGAVDGIIRFFVPNLSSFLDIEVWRVATEQAFYSLGVATGPLITFGSYSRFNSPCQIDASIICVCVILTSILCSMVIFSVLGVLAKSTGRPFETVVEAGPGLVFVAYPEALSLLPAASFFGVLFYVMLLNLGITSVNGTAETVCSAIYDTWPATRRYKYLVILGLVIIWFLMGVAITVRGGLVVYHAFDTFSAGLTLIPVCTLEIITTIYIYGVARFCEDIAFMIGFYPNRYYRYQWMLAPFILLGVNLYGVFMMKLEGWRTWSLILGWTLFMCVFGAVPFTMIYRLIEYGRKKDLKNVIKPPVDHGPKDPEKRMMRALFVTDRKIW